MSQRGWILRGRRKGDFRPCERKTVNFGRTWTSMVGGLPRNDPARVVWEDSRNPWVLRWHRAGGVCRRTASAGGRGWGAGCWWRPGATCRCIRERGIAVATDKRSARLLDVMSLWKLAVEAVAANAHLFEPHEAML